MKHQAPTAREGPSFKLEPPTSNFRRSTSLQHPKDPIARGPVLELGASQIPHFPLTPTLSPSAGERGNPRLRELVPGLKAWAIFNSPSRRAGAPHSKSARTE